MEESDWHRVRMELTAAQSGRPAVAESAEVAPADRRSRSVQDGDITDALLEHIALALDDRADLSS